MRPKPLPWLRLVLGGLTAVALPACGKEPRKATPEDTAGVRVTCGKHADYDPKKSAEVVAQMDARRPHVPSPWRDALEDVCYFSKEGLFIAYTQIEREDTRSRELLCEALRDSGATGTIAPIHIHCSDGKRCTTCQQGGGGHR